MNTDAASMAAGRTGTPSRAGEAREAGPAGAPLTLLGGLFEPVSAHDRRLAQRADGILATFNAAGVLTAADVHVAAALARAAGEADDSVVLAAALATRAVRTGSVAVDLGALARLGSTPGQGPTPADLGQGAAAADADLPAVDLTQLPWPPADTWTQTVADSTLAARGALVVDQGLVYLQRYHQQEVQIVGDLRARAAGPAPEVDEQQLDVGLEAVFAGESFAEQRAAARVAVHSWTSVITGGPGTGKTTTVAGVLALLARQAGATRERPLRVGLAAPTGKAAARMAEAVAEALDGILARTDDPQARAAVEPLRDVPAQTIHRLLGWNPGSRTRFRHDRDNRLPHQVVIVDEASMVSLTHMARLLEAVRPQARLILVGDADQLVSVDAGAVLGDLVAGVAGTSEESASGGSRGAPVALARLRTVHRFGTTIGELAEALRRGDADAVVAALSAGTDQVQWIPEPDPAQLRSLLVRQARAVHDAAARGDATQALDALRSHRLLCAHRDGPQGVRTWNRLTEGWLAEELGIGLYEPMYLGRPLLVTANDYATGVLNGDTGVVVASQTPDGVPVRMAVIDGSGGEHRLAPGRLGEIETMHAMTIHKAQGSQAAQITVLLPEADSPLLTRELFYTGVTRAKEQVRIVGTEAVVRAAVERRVVRASGLRRRLAGG